jgi:hypothetical protein
MAGGCAFAIGAAPKNTETYANEAESGRFTLLFWGNGEEVELFVREAPAGWDVILDPQTVALDGSGTEYVSAGTTYVKAKAAHVYVRPDKSGDGYVVIGARARKGEGMITFSQETYFNLTVRKSEPPRRDLIGDVGKGIADFANSITGSITSLAASNAFPVMAGIAFIAAAAVFARLYREYRKLYKG